MKNLCVLVDALEIVEDNICNEISQEGIAASCYCSLSSLQKLFRYCFHMSLGDYITRRKLTLAANDLVNREDNILDIAIKYGYNSAEVFTRAFRKVWHTTPSDYRKNHKFSGLYPKIDFNFDGGNINMKKQFDITMLYDCLKSRLGKYILSFDMKNLMVINDTYGHEAGDKAILECLHRLENITDDDMLMFRIGGDEFVIVTNTDQKDEVISLGEKIISLNGNTINHDGVDIAVAMSVGAVRIENRNVRYGDLFTELVDVARAARIEDNANNSYTVAFKN